MNGIMVLSPGFRTTVQDLGRFGYQSMGVPPSGALDRDALETANLLVGNARDDACLECIVLGPELLCGMSLAFAVCGAAMGLRLNGIPAPMYETLYAESGDLISLGGAEAGLCAYIAFAGGFAIEPVLGSRSTYLPAGFGGWQGRALAVGDSLPLRAHSGASGSGTARRRFVPVELWPTFPNEIVVRALRSHEAHRFDPAALPRFFSEPYRVSAKSDRMGCRLEGGRLGHVRGADILSSGVQSGTVQVPGDGLPIVLLADRQTTGGYTRIAHVIQADLPRLGQARPGDLVRFVETTLEAARQALLAREAMIAGLVRDAGSVRRFRVEVNGVLYHVDVEPEAQVPGERQGS
jgi:biotin-dependent carboxylase-like uncharacterized protein